MIDVTDRWDMVRLALRLLAVDPGNLGGVVVRSRAGPARDACLAGFPDLGLNPVRLHPSMMDQDLFGGIDVAGSLGAGRLVYSAGALASRALFTLTMAERCPSELAARLAAMMDRSTGSCLVLLDEGAEPDEAAPRVLVERVAFHVDLNGLRAPEVLSTESSEIVDARQSLGRVVHSATDIEQLTATAASLGIDSLRAPLFAVRTARCHAALCGRKALEREDLEVASMLVFAHRAECLPAAEQPPQRPEPEPEKAERGESTEKKPDEDMLVEAVRAVLPDGILPDSRDRQRVQSGTGQGDVQVSKTRGRPKTPQRKSPDGRSRIDLIATLRNAAPWQTLRRVPGRRVSVAPSDICLKRYETQTERLLIFTVDASGSAARARLNEAKGAVELLLARAYAHRDRVALIGFRNDGASLLMPPNRSLLQAKRRLAAMAGGGATPLASGLQSAATLAQKVQKQGMTPTLILLTDGRANVALDGERNRQRAKQDAESAASWIRASRIRSVVLDTAIRPQADLIHLAERMGAEHLPLPRSDARGMSKAIEASVRS